MTMGSPNLSTSSQLGGAVNSNRELRLQHAFFMEKILCFSPAAGVTCHYVFIRTEWIHAWRRRGLQGLLPRQESPTFINGVTLRLVGWVDEPIRWESGLFVFPVIMIKVPERKLIDRGNGTPLERKKKKKSECE